MSELTVLEKPITRPKLNYGGNQGRPKVPILIVVRPSSSGMLRHVQGLIKYLPEYGFVPMLTGPDVIRDRPGFFADSHAIKSLRHQASGFPLVHCHGVRAGWICALAFRDRSPWVWTVHHLLRHRSALVRALWRWIARYPRVVLAVSDSVREGLVKGGVPETRVHVVHGGIDLERFERLPMREAMRQQFYVPPDRPVVLCVGRFVYHKGFDLALRAMNEVWQIFPEADIWLAGDGPDNTRLVKLTLQSHYPHHVRFFGYWSAVEELYASADVLSAPARDAGLGLAVMEAMACGLPIVVSDIPQMKRLVEHEKTGLIMPPNDVQALAQATIRLLQDKALAHQLAQNARQNADRFHIRHTVEQTVPYYRRIIES